MQSVIATVVSILLRCIKFAEVVLDSLPADELSEFKIIVNTPHVDINVLLGLFNVLFTKFLSKVQASVLFKALKKSNLAINRVVECLLRQNKKSAFYNLYMLVMRLASKIIN